MQERIKQSEKMIKKLSEDLRKQLIFINLMEKPTKAAKDKFYKIEGLLSAEVCELVRLSYEIALMYEEMITSPDINLRMKAEALKCYFSSNCVEPQSPDVRFIKKNKIR
ncbi:MULTISPECIES: hypothetical protein [Vibrio]|jgi:hypothetical protein|uniref:hypothetical protein n=1 Tax=Vibrio TaxID=662 RepID=UPI0014484B1F|nr:MULTISPECIES: hypothetical protein [Vibrio]MDE1215468.1 hypothetical protein [Vibrio aestuarianus]MDE1217990.1 hypothetical protein [Vibrio aestuarianus]MDE1262558.1 hypothetical protein [Vibrio aestuarianus]MDE1269663.1 hypothetical protein [Vibrio aestuarianus]MDE1276826.1 hypothetical protein [Vibrio aestuarianus]